MRRLEGTLLAPKRHESVPKEAKWLSGQGEGTWFCITKEEGLSEKQFRVRRISPQGNLDCDRVFELEENSSNFNINIAWDINHVSHCAQVRTLQNDIVYVMNFVRERSNN